ncbi:MAG: glycosyltransferase [Phycisphaerae bacterium]|nr:glycosyltransferase [Phycisphaerae bacterium]MCZ2401162.1 glycosyltransferase [Phycisphaerae bacterium]
MTSGLIAIASTGAVVMAGAPLDSLPLAAWFILTCLIGVGWLRRHLDIRRARREPGLSPDDAARLPDRAPSLSVLVAAKDEGENIGRCLDTLLGQQYPELQVIAVNDRSADDTGAIIDRRAAADPRLTALHVQSLPEGWFGKNHAMHTGVSHARGEWLAFTDADCTFDSPLLLAAAVAHADRHGIDFLSVLPRLEARGFWERVVQPVAGGVLLIWFPPRRVNDPRSACAYANGAFMLLRRSAYERLGGHVPVRATLNEDMHLARRAKQLGLRLKVVRGGDLYRVRMYEGFPQIWRGWTRIFYGCFGTLPRLVGSVLLLSLFSLSPYLTIALAPLCGSAWPWLAGAGVFTVAAQQSVLVAFYRLTGNSPWLAATYPLGAAVCLGMTLNAIRRLGGTTTTWRGTTYHGGAQTAP